MRKSIEQLIHVGFNIKIALNCSHFALYLYEEDAYIDFSLTRQISKENLSIIPNFFRIIPDVAGKITLRIFELEEQSE